MLKFLRTRAYKLSQWPRWELGAGDFGGEGLWLRKELGPADVRQSGRYPAFNPWPAWKNSGFRRGEALGEHHFDQALVRHVASVGFAFDGVRSEMVSVLALRLGKMTFCAFDQSSARPSLADIFRMRLMCPACLMLSTNSANIVSFI